MAGATMTAWVFCGVFCAGAAMAECRQALALALDVSGSVDGREYRLQIEGLADALTGPQVAARILAQPEAPIRLTVYEWSGPTYQAVILPWTEIAGPDDLAAAAATLRATQRRQADPSTAIGAALLAGFALLDQQPDCWKRTLDVSGDGENNTGPRPQTVPTTHLPAGATVNGLVIGSIPQAGDDRDRDLRDLGAYYAANVIRGPGAFVEPALGFDDFATAMERKLLRELSAIAIGAAGPALAQ